jgi:hypothetical protein
VDARRIGDGVGVRVDVQVDVRVEFKTVVISLLQSGS